MNALPTIWPEERKLVAHELQAGSFRVIATLDHQRNARIPPFEEMELDLGYILAGSPGAGSSEP